MWQIQNAIGLKETAAKVRAYEAEHGARWKLAALIERLANEGGKLATAGKG